MHHRAKHDLDQTTSVKVDWSWQCDYFGLLAYIVKKEEERKKADAALLRLGRQQQQDPLKTKSLCW